MVQKQMKLNLGNNRKINKNKSWLFETTVKIGKLLDTLTMTKKNETENTYIMNKKVSSLLTL